MIRNIKKAFTLAEILVALAIVGIVAAVTVPTMTRNVNYEGKYVDAQYKKVFGTLDEAALNIMANSTNGTTINGLFTSNSVTMNELAKYIHFQQRGTSSSTYWPGTPAPTATINGTSYALTGSSYYSGIAPDGAVYTVLSASSTCSATYAMSFPHVDGSSSTGHEKSISNGCALIYVDVNGKKGPNADKKDRFAFVIGANGLKSN